MPRKTNHNGEKLDQNQQFELTPQLANQIVEDSLTARVSGSGFKHQVAVAYEAVKGRFHSWWRLYCSIRDDAQKINPQLIEGLPLIGYAENVTHELLTDCATQLKIISRRIQSVGSSDNSKLSNLSYLIADLLEIIDQYYLIVLVADQTLV